MCLQTKDGTLSRMFGAITTFQALASGFDAHKSSWLWANSKPNFVSQGTWSVDTSSVGHTRIFASRSVSGTVGQLVDSNEKGLCSVRCKHEVEEVELDFSQRLLPIVLYRRSFSETAFPRRPVRWSHGVPLHQQAGCGDPRDESPSRRMHWNPNSLAVSWSHETSLLAGVWIALAIVVGECGHKNIEISGITPPPPTHLSAHRIMLMMMMRMVIVIDPT